MIAYIPISSTELAVVDLDDVATLLAFTWCKSGNGYAHTRIPSSGKPGKRLLMHRLLCEGELIDHINGDKLDNRKSNLRPVSKRQNALNSIKQRGVYKSRNKWRAAVTIDNRSIHIGTFDTYEQAAFARNAYIEVYWKESVK